MPIVESKILKVVNNKHLYMMFRDHLGKWHELRMRRPAKGANDAKTLIDSVARVEASLIRQEERKITEDVKAGADPVNVRKDHASDDQRLRAAVKGMMEGDAKRVIKTAERINDISERRLNELYNPSQTARIKNRAAHIVGNKSTLETDDQQREEM